MSSRGVSIGDLDPRTRAAVERVAQQTGVTVGPRSPLLFIKEMRVPASHGKQLAADRALFVNMKPGAIIEFDPSEIEWQAPTRITVRLPWSCLIRDNDRHVPVVRGRKAFIILTKSYRAAKKKARALIAEQLAGVAPITGRVRLTAVMFEPDRRSRRDISNYEKLAHDVLTGLAYVDDSQIDKLTWERGEADIDAPRLEITVEVMQ